MSLLISNKVKTNMYLASVSVHYTYHLCVPLSPTYTTITITITVCSTQPFAILFTTANVIVHTQLHTSLIELRLNVVSFVLLQMIDFLRNVFAFQIYLLSVVWPAIRTQHTTRPKWLHWQHYLLAIGHWQKKSFSSGWELPNIYCSDNKEI